MYSWKVWEIQNYYCNIMSITMIQTISIISFKSQYRKIVVLIMLLIILYHCKNYLIMGNSYRKLGRERKAEG